MHEMGIAMQIVEIAGSAIPADVKNPSVAKVNIRVGKLTAVVPSSLTFCFNIATQDTPLAGAELSIEEVPVVEAPWMIRHQGVYYLLYSGGSADSRHYAIGYATASGPLGPFTKYTGNPIVSGGDGVYGPGHASVVRDGAGKLWMVYHQQKDATRGWNRIICIDPLRFGGDGVLRGKASRGIPLPAPAPGDPE